MSLYQAERETTLFASPALPPSQVRARHAAWNRDETVRSELIAVGRLALTEQEQLFLAGRRVLNPAYNVLPETSALLPRLANLRQAFLELVMADAERSGLEGNVTTKVFAGRYDAQVSAEPWHADDHPYIAVRYAASFGDVGSTLGAIGQVRRSDIWKDGANRGNLRPGIPVGPGRQLDLQIHSNGTLIRWTAPDIHAGPPGEGARVFLQATVHLP